MVIRVPLIAPRARLRPDRPARGSRSLGAARRLLESLLVLTAATAAAQDAATERITITGRAPGAAISGFGSQPLFESPLQASVFDTGALAQAGNLAGLTALDAGVSDAYNAVGYWSSLTVRGFVLDNRSNYRRDGLPINAETALGLANKERVEILKGTSGVQAGISAPGGLVNLVVKRPTERLRQARLALDEQGAVEASVDWADRFGDAGQVGLRVNVAADRLRPPVRDADGERQLLAVASDAQLSPDSRIEAEFELSRQSQPSVPGFSLRGDTLPDADQVDPRINLNNQPWSLPVVLEGATASLRWRQRLNADWRLSAHAMTQRLKSDDRVAFPFGCFDAGTSIYYADRYCPDGSFDLYDFRSDNERRRTDALDLQANGRVRSGSVGHELTAGVLFSRQRDRFQRQAFNYAGQGRDDGSVLTPAAPDLTGENTNRDARSTELYLRDAITLSEDWSLWAGLRYSRLHQSSELTDGSEPLSYTQNLTTPWLGLTHRLSRNTVLYTSWGEGVETDIAPNLPRYVNAGEPLPALKSRQWEAGVKQDRAGGRWSLVAFQIDRPQAADLGACDVDDSCTRRIDGSARHRGLEGSFGVQRGPWAFDGSAQWLHARRQGASDPGVNGKQPTNVPRLAAQARLSYALPQFSGMSVHAALQYEGPRQVLPDNSIEAPGWSRLDVGWRWRVAASDGRIWTWSAGVDNLTDARAWRDTPYQFGHVYLFPLAPRTWRTALVVDF